MDPRVIDWLLEEENPGVRHAALTTLLDRPADDAEVIEARQALMQVDSVRTIMSHQEPGGHWSAPLFVRRVYIRYEAELEYEHAYQHRLYTTRAQAALPSSMQDLPMMYLFIPDTPSDTLD